MTHNTRKSIFLLGFFVIALLAWSGNALAVDGKLYPGIMCVTGGGPTSDILRYRPDGGISNTLEQQPVPPGQQVNNSIPVQCLVLKDHHKQSKGVSTVRVYYTNNSSEKIRCYARAAGLGIQHDTPNVVSEEGNVGPHTGFITIPGPQTATNEDYYLLACDLPNKSEIGESIIHAYYVEEK